MIDVHVQMRVHGLTDPILTQICDTFAGLETLCPDLLEWSVAASLGESLLEFDLTIGFDDANRAVFRASELIQTALQTAGVNVSATGVSNVTTELIDA